MATASSMDRGSLTSSSTQSVGGGGGSGGGGEGSSNNVSYISPNLLSRRSSARGSGSTVNTSEQQYQQHLQQQAQGQQHSYHHQQQQPPVKSKNPSLITFGQKSVRARVDANVPLDEIIRQLCSSPQLAVQEPAALFALRDATNNDLITPDNLDSKLRSGVPLKLVPAPVIEAVDTIERLLGDDVNTVKQATFALRAYMREEAFVSEFVKRNGVAALANVIQSSTGNTLAYALSAMQTLLDLDQGLDRLNEEFTVKVISITASQALVNIVRPALSILRKLVTTSHPSFGFMNLFPSLLREEGFFRSLYQRITREEDKLLIGTALGFLNSLMRNIPSLNEKGKGRAISEEYAIEAFETLERNHFRKAVISLIENHAEDVTPQILQFQQNYANLWHQQQLTPLSLTPDPDNPTQTYHQRLLETVWVLSGVEADPETGARDYRKLGFTHPTPSDGDEDFQGAGLFGLMTLKQIASTRTEEYSKMILEQVNRPSARRCPIALVSVHVSKLLSEHFDFSGSLASASFQPFLLDYYRVHLLVMDFFVRLYQDSGATIKEVPRVATLVRSQVRITLSTSNLQGGASGTGNFKGYYDVHRELGEVRYEEVRDRQMKELEIEDDLLSKLPVRNLRDRLYRESFDFLRAQRINCMQIGAWFTLASPSPILSPGGGSQRTRLPPAIHKYRFCRLSPNKRYIHYIDSNERRTIRPGFDDLPEKIDLAMISEVVSGLSARQSIARHHSISSSAASPHNTADGSGGAKSPQVMSGFVGVQSGTGTNTQTATTTAGTSQNPLSVVFLSHDNVIAELIAPDASTYSEWLDGLNLLLPEGFIVTQTSAEFVHTLTDLGVKIKLLDLTGERLEIPTSMPLPIPPPPDVPFYYAE